MSDFIPYDENNITLYGQYKKENYLIRYNAKASMVGCCYVYFSGNGLYSVNNKTDFEMKVEHDNRYEWLNLSPRKKPEKEIFVRDVWLAWYILGINEDLNTIDKIVSWLDKECEGYKVTLVGNSAGGFMAVNCAKRMKSYVERVFTFCGQFSLDEHNNHTHENNLLVKYRSTDFFDVTTPPDG